jgi:hypothetical protein
VGVSGNPSARNPRVLACLELHGPIAPQRSGRLRFTRPSPKQWGHRWGAQRLGLDG